MINSRRGTDEGYSVGFAQVDKLCIFRQKSVTRMDSLQYNGYAEQRIPAVKDRQEGFIMERFSNAGIRSEWIESETEPCPTLESFFHLSFNIYPLITMEPASITSHHTTSHYITSHYITSHHTTSHHTTSHHITSHHITSHHITSHSVFAE